MNAAALWRTKRFVWHAKMLRDFLKVGGRVLQTGLFCQPKCMLYIFGLVNSLYSTSSGSSSPKVRVHERLSWIRCAFQSLVLHRSYKSLQPLPFCIGNKYVSSHFHSNWDDWWSLLFLHRFDDTQSHQNITGFWSGTIRNRAYWAYNTPLYFNAGCNSLCTP